MTSPGQLAAMARKKLRYFQYLPPMGGFGGDWDTLNTTIPLADEPALRTLLDRLGRHGDLPPAGTRTELEFIQVSGLELGLYVDRRQGDAVELVAGIYITPELITRVAELERWLVETAIFDGGEGSEGG